MFLKGQHVGLRKLSERDDLTNYLEMVNNPDYLAMAEGLGERPLNESDLRHYINETDGLFLGIFDPSESHVGNIHLSSIKTTHRNAVLGIVMHPKMTGKGYASEACELVIRHAFTRMNLHRVALWVCEKNTAAIKLYEKLGFVKEGIQREAFWLDGKFVDMIAYGILAEDYKSIKKTN